MIALHVRLHVRSGQNNVLEGYFRTDYLTAIRMQKGFLGGQLLRPYGEPDEYVIVITFESEELRLAWVASPEHQASWSKIEALCSSVADEGFDMVAEV